MKKLFFLSLMLTTMLAAQAQLKVAPKMQKGAVKNYATTSVIELPGQSPLTVSSECSYAVAEVKADGCILNMTTNNVTSDAAATNIAGQLIAASQKVLKGFTLKVATDAEGKVQKIANYAEVQNLMNTQSDLLVDQLLKAVPQIDQMIPKETLKQQITSGITEENLVLALQNAISPIALNGKTLMTGAQEEYVNEQGMKMKRMYFVNGNNVTTNGSMNMSKDELKTLIIQQVEKSLPDQADMIKQNIDQLMNSGMLKMEMKETASYELQPDGWVKSIKAESTHDAMGQKMKTTTTVTLK